MLSEKLLNAIDFIHITQFLGGNEGWHLDCTYHMHLKHIDSCLKKNLTSKMIKNISKNTILLFYCLSYLFTLIIVSDSVGFAHAYAEGKATYLFTLGLFLAYSGLYLIPSIVLTLLAQLIFKHPSKIVSTTAIVSSGITSVLLYANAKIYSLYGMFINGFIINLVTTPGGIESMGGSTASDIGFAMIALGLIAVHACFWWLSKYASKINILSNLKIQANLKYLVLSFGILIFLLQGYYAVNDAFYHNSLFKHASTIPFFKRITAQHFFSRIGFNISPSQNIKIKGQLKYPLKALAINDSKPYNIIWLTSESWRADTLNQEVMPKSFAFAQQAINFQSNLSGGNGTRMGVFSMMTGLPGNYWFSFMHENKGAALFDVLQQKNYQIQLYTSALFSYPEFDQTIFSHVPKQYMHELQNTGLMGWQRDRKNVTDMLSFIANRDHSKPFFTFMFFESPHARYHFPAESIIKTNYRNDINYATLNRDALRDNIVPIKNRYLNAVHHLDSQFARVFEFMKQEHLMEKTIVILVGDHGEEFMEHGYWGHNSTFVDQQIHTPLVIYIPNTPAKVVKHMTSHMDIIPTLMPLLGVKNPASDYALGNNLLSNTFRTYTYSSDWSRITYIDNNVKETFDLSGYSTLEPSTHNDKPLNQTQANALNQQRLSIIHNIMADLSKFLSAY